MLTQSITPGIHLILNYQPSQPHGWPPGPGQALGMTIGGHVTSADFEHGERSYRISLLSFDQPGDAADPVYEDEPADPDIAYKRTLADAFGADYAFRYVGLRGERELEVQSYSVFASQETELSPLVYGADLYVVYEPESRGGPAAVPGTMRWVQVARRSRAEAPAESHVDPVGGTHPFSPTGGRTSIYGNRIVNFDHHDGTLLFDAGPDDDGVILSGSFMAEVFLARDTGIKDAAGKEVVEVLGGIKHGWQVEEQRP